MKVAKSVSLVLLSLIALGILAGYTLGAGPIDLDILWTTDAAGTTEINEFFVGDPVYLRTNPNKMYPLPEDSQYIVYIFEGNLEPENGDLIPDDFGTPLGLTPLTVATDSNGHFGPVLIWDHCEYTPPRTDYTVILDCTVYRGFPAGNIGWYDEHIDWRDDLCTAVPTPPSFHVIPEVLLGTIAVLGSMFGGLGIYLVRRKKSQNLN